MCGMGGFVYAMASVCRWEVNCVESGLFFTFTWVPETRPRSSDYMAFTHRATSPVYSQAVACREPYPPTAEHTFWAVQSSPFVWRQCSAYGSLCSVLSEILWGNKYLHPNTPCCSEEPLWVACIKGQWNLPLQHCTLLWSSLLRGQNFNIANRVYSQTASLGNFIGLDQLYSLWLYQDKVIRI